MKTKFLDSAFYCFWQELCLAVFWGGDQSISLLSFRFRTVLRLRHSARTGSRGTGHHLWTDHSHYHGQYYWRWRFALLSLSLSVTGLYGE